MHAAGGGNYQTLINHALREYVQSRTPPLEEIVRRIVREELLATTAADKSETVVA